MRSWRPSVEVERTSEERDAHPLKLGHDAFAHLSLGAAFPVLLDLLVRQPQTAIDVPREGGLVEALLAHPQPLFLSVVRISRTSLGPHCSESGVGGVMSRSTFSKRQLV